MLVSTQCVQNSRQVLSIPSPVPFSCHMPKPVAPAVTCLCCHLAPAWPWSVPEDELLSPGCFWAESWPGTRWRTRFGWWQPADCHHLPWVSSLSPACSAQLGTERFIEGSWRQQWVAALLLTLGGYTKEDNKESPRFCEMCWLFASLLQWIGVWSTV